MSTQHEGVIALSTKPAPADKPEFVPVNTHPGPDFPGAGASETGLMVTGPAAGAISILQRVRDGLAALPAISTEENGAA